MNPHQSATGCRREIPIRRVRARDRAGTCTWAPGRAGWPALASRGTCVQSSAYDSAECTALSGLWRREPGGNAGERVRVLLGVPGLSDAREASAGRLLRVLLLRFGPLPTEAAAPLTQALPQAHDERVNREEMG